jgi:antagonist of KipI
MIEVLKPGFHTLVQDAGRCGFQEFGMPVSGVMDVDSYRLANWLVGNVLSEAILEITMVGPKLEFQKDTFIGLSGADISPKIDGKTIEQYKTIPVSKGSVLTFGKLENGCRCYLAIAGGVDVDIEMGSRSTYAYATIGGVDGRELYKGDVLKIGKQKPLEIKIVPEELQRRQFSLMSVRVMEGPEFNLLSENDVDSFFRQEFVISKNSNRMGCRLEGVVLSASKTEMISSGVVNGAIQLPPSGAPIILLAEAQTTGGYPRIANVIKSDLPLLAQQKTGDKIRFRNVSLEVAQANFFNKMKRFKDFLGTGF